MTLSNLVLGLFQHISGHIRMVPACNRGYGNHFKERSRWNITPQTVVWYLAQSHYSGNESTRFYIQLPFICRVFDKGASSTNLNTYPYIMFYWLNSPNHLTNMPYQYHYGLCNCLANERCAWSTNNHIWCLVTVGDTEERISTPKLQRGDNFILAVYYYLSFKFLHDLAISPLCFSSWKPYLLWRPWIHVH